MKRVKSGNRNQLLTYQTPVYGLNALRQRTVTGYTDASTHWCEVRAPNGREAIDATQRKVIVTHVITTDFPGADLDPKGRLTDGSRNFDITATTDPDGLRVELVIYATRSPNAEGA